MVEPSTASNRPNSEGGASTVFALKTQGKVDCATTKKYIHVTIQSIIQKKLYNLFLLCV